MRAACGGLAVASTVAPRWAANWTIRPPVTPPAPFTSTVCPAWTFRASLDLVGSAPGPARPPQASNDTAGGSAAMCPWAIELLGLLVAQRCRCVVIRSAGADVVHGVPGRGDQTGRLDTEGHRRAGPGVPVAGAGRTRPSCPRRPRGPRSVPRPRAASAGRGSSSNSTGWRGRIPAAYMAALRAQSGLLAVTLIRRPAPRRRRFMSPCSSPWSWLCCLDR